ncbi:MAG: cyclic pyranopterin monophosphate synthase MoaC [Candidatus Eisenbacteria bacterium]|uniref:cyclic pyranopterin monophosphate synthase n=1 Tax=Eiseniibacteriota bacterium TaxID=2212470 RepID=A0A948RW21_UNCEI|nr:cyclic pyranopterin monophosphate synthase MoaC [Candidatus Eisenbacteria bacterium]MBU1951013.1 cyclic pyranopterin monophosphate synthase MoaC [Candidatus Eisenbacteria bacterium]MBU2690042.1 cyclic pyranopterin monophosphate synthase MoaC [Candidatus Eisenbacteria bacterium]
MVDVGDKAVTQRRALAEGFVTFSPKTFEEVREHGVAKGDVFATARIAGIQGAKKCSELIPLCHPIAMDHVELRFEEDPSSHRIRILAETRSTSRTGIEMEAMAAVSIAALTIYDMVKGLERGIKLGPFRLLEKVGGRSGDWRADR